MLKRMIENMKGVLWASVNKEPAHQAHMMAEDDAARRAKVEEIMSQLEEVRSMIDPESIDMDDERTRYILSK